MKSLVNNQKNAKQNKFNIFVVACCLQAEWVELEMAKNVSAHAHALSRLAWKSIYLLHCVVAGRGRNESEKYLKTKRWKIAGKEFIAKCQGCAITAARASQVESVAGSEAAVAALLFWLTVFVNNLHILRQASLQMSAYTHTHMSMLLATNKHFLLPTLMQLSWGTA